MGIFNPHVVSKAGPDWMWGGGRNDVLRDAVALPSISLQSPRNQVIL